MVPIPILMKSGYETFDFLVDTGADCSIIPKRVASDLDVDLSRLPRLHFRGIGGSSIAAYVTKITIKIGDHPLGITCVLSDNEQNLFILGRKDIFPKFNILFDNENGMIGFSLIK